MKKAELFIYFTVALGCISVAFREYKYGSEHSPFIYWLMAGLIVGLMSSGILIWRYYPKTSDGKFEPRMKSPALVAISITTITVLCFFGMSMINLSVQMKKATDEVQNWPSVQATIEGQQVYEKPPGKTAPIWWAPTWSYFYEINGKTFHSHSTSAENAYALIPKDSKEEAQKDLRQRPVGSQVTAFYSPENPELSVLDKRSDYPTTRYLILAVGIFILFASSVGGVLISRKIMSGNFK